MPSAPVILETVPAAPPMTPEKTLRTPMTTPSANSDGPSTAPWNVKEIKFNYENEFKIWTVAMGHDGLMLKDGTHQKI